MILSRRVALDGVQLDESHARIAIQGMQTGKPKGDGNAAARYGGSGSRRIPPHRESLDVVISFSIVIKRGQADEREAALEAANAWAAIAENGAWMTWSTKPGRRIRVWLEEPAVMGDARSDANKNFSIRFRAYGVPNWQESESSYTTLEAGMQGSGSLVVGGNTKTCAEIRAENVSGAAISWVEVSAGTSTIRMENIGMAAGETLIIDHDPEGLIRLRILGATGSRSILDKRTDGSANDLWVSPGYVQISFASQRAIQVTAEARGRFL